MSSDTSVSPAVQLVEQYAHAVTHARNETERKAASDALLQFNASSQPYDTCLTILQRGTSTTAQYSALGAIKDAAMREWGTDLPAEKGLWLANHLFTFACSRSNDLPTAVTNKLVQVVAILSKRSWPSEGLGSGTMSTTTNDQAINAFVSQQSQTLMNMVTMCLTQQSPLHQDLGFTLANAFLTEFSAGESSEMGLPWEFHVRCHKLFELNMLRPLMNTAIQYLQSRVPLLCDVQSGEELDHLLPPITRAVILATKILGWEYDEETTNQAFLMRSIASGTSLSTAASSSRTHGLGLAIEGRSLGTLSQGRSAQLDNASNIGVSRPGSSWTDLIVGGSLHTTLIQLYASATTGNSNDPAGVQGDNPRFTNNTVQSSLSSSSYSKEPSSRRDRKSVRSFCGHIFQCFTQLASLQGSVFDAPGVADAVARAAQELDAEASNRNMNHPNNTNTINNSSNNTGNTNNTNNASMYGMVERRLEQAAATAGKGALATGYVRSLTASLAPIVQRVVNVHTQRQSSSSGSGSSGSSNPYGNNDSVEESFTIDVIGLCSVLQRIPKSFTLEALLSDASSSTSFLNLTLALTRIVLSDAVVSRYGIDAVDTWAVDGFDLLLDAWSTTASMLEQSQADFTSLSSALSTYTDEVFDMYVRMRLSLATTEAERDGQVTERFYSDADGGVGTHVGDAMAALALLARVNPVRSIVSISQAIQQRVDMLNSILSGTLPATETQIHIVHECVWWLLEFLSHLLCDLGSGSGEEPVIPYALLCSSNAHCRNLEASSGLISNNNKNNNNNNNGSLLASHPELLQQAMSSDAVVQGIQCAMRYLEYENNALQSRMRGKLKSNDPAKLQSLAHAHMQQQQHQLQQQQQGQGQGQGQSVSVSSALASLLDFSIEDSTAVSPYVGCTLLRLLDRWALTYLCPNSSKYTTLSPSIWCAFDSSSPLCRQLLSTILDKAQINLIFWGSESEVAEKSCALICSIMSSPRLRSLAVMSPAFPSLLTTFSAACVNDPWFKPFLQRILSSSPAHPTLQVSALQFTSMAAQAAGISLTDSSSTSSSSSSPSSSPSDTSVAATAAAMQASFLSTLGHLNDSVLTRFTHALCLAAAAIRIPEDLEDKVPRSPTASSPSSLLRASVLLSVCRPIKARLDHLISLPLLQTPASSHSQDDLQEFGNHLITTISLLRGVARSTPESILRPSFAFLSHTFDILAKIIRYLNGTLPSVTLAILRLIGDIADNSLILLKSNEVRVFLIQCVDMMQAYLSSHANNLKALANKGDGVNSPRNSTASTPSHQGSNLGATTYVINGDDEEAEEDEELACLSLLLSTLKHITSRQALDLSSPFSSSSSSSSSTNKTKSVIVDPQSETIVNQLLQHMGLSSHIQLDASDTTLPLLTLNEALPTGIQQALQYQLQQQQQQQQQSTPPTTDIWMINVAASLISSNGSIDPSRLALDAVISGLCMVAPLLSAKVLDNVKISTQYFDLLGSVAVTKASKLTEVPQEYFSLIIESIKWGIGSSFRDVARNALVAGEAVATYHFSCLRDLQLTVQGCRPKGTHAIVMRYVTNYQQQHGLQGMNNSDVWLAAMPFGQPVRALLVRFFMLLFFEPTDTQLLLNEGGNALFSMIQSICSEDALRLLELGHTPSISTLDESGIPLLLRSYCACIGQLLNDWESSNAANGRDVTSSSSSIKQWVLELVSGVDLIGYYMGSIDSNQQRIHLKQFKQNLTKLVTKIRSLGQMK